jgi:hypothetical protein
MSFLNTEIPRVTAALTRHEARIDAMSNEWARLGMPCCPGCMFGSDYTSAVDKAERTARWLAHLLRKRGRPQDLRKAARIEADLPPPLVQRGGTK